VTKTAILLDLDNTLYHYDPCNDAALAAVHELLQTKIDVSFDQFMRLHDSASKDLALRLEHQAASHNRLLLFKQMVEKLVERPDPKLTLALNACYWRAFYGALAPHPDGHHVLAELSKSFALAIVSNQIADPQLEKLHRLGYAPYISAVVTSEEVGVEKPDARVFDIALARLGVPARAAVMVGDDYARDIVGARRAGITAIHTIEFEGREPEKSDADHTIERLEELLGIL